LPVDHAPDRRRGIVKELRSRLDDLSSKVSKQKPNWPPAAVEAQQAIPQANRREEGKEELGSARTQDVN
jgi:hypothetical protein